MLVGRHNKCRIERVAEQNRNGKRTKAILQRMVSPLTVPSSLLEFIVSSELGGGLQLAIVLYLAWTAGSCGIISPATFLFAGGLYAFSYWHTKTMRVRRRLTWSTSFVEKEPETARRLLGNDLPTWVCLSSVERSHWFQLLIVFLWPKIRIATNKSVESAVGDLVKEKVAAKLSGVLEGVALSRIDVGPIPPTVDGVQVHRTINATIIDFHIFWAGTAFAELNAVLKGGKTEAQEREQRASQMRVRDLFRTSSPPSAFDSSASSRRHNQYSTTANTSSTTSSRGGGSYSTNSSADTAAYHVEMIKGLLENLRSFLSRRNVKLAVTDIQIKGILRLTLGPHCHSWPCFEAIRVSFVGCPLIDFKIKVTDYFSLDALPGVPSFIERSVADFFTENLLYPKALTLSIPASEQWQGMDAMLEPIGCVFVTVRFATGLPISNVGVWQMFGLGTMTYVRATYTNGDPNKRVTYRTRTAKGENPFYDDVNAVAAAYATSTRKSSATAEGGGAHVGSPEEEEAYNRKKQKKSAAKKGVSFGGSEIAGTTSSLLRGEGAYSSPTTAAAASNEMARRFVENLVTHNRQGQGASTGGGGGGGDSDKKDGGVGLGSLPSGSFGAGTGRGSVPTADFGSGLGQVGRDGGGAGDSPNDLIAQSVRMQFPLYGVQGEKVHLEVRKARTIGEKVVMASLTQSDTIGYVELSSIDLRTTKSHRLALQAEGQRGDVESTIEANAALVAKDGERPFLHVTTEYRGFRQAVPIVGGGNSGGRGVSSSSKMLSAGLGVQHNALADGGGGASLVHHRRHGGGTARSTRRRGFSSGASNSSFSVGSAVDPSSPVFSTGGYSSAAGSGSSILGGGQLRSATSAFDRSLGKLHSLGGLLVVHICRADNLPAGDVNGLSDPFVTVRIGRSAAATPIVFSTLFPKWDRMVYLNVEDAARDVMDVAVFDYDRFSSNDLLGRVRISVVDVLTDGGVSLPKPYALDRQGTITLGFKLMQFEPTSY